MASDPRERGCPLPSVSPARPGDSRGARGEEEVGQGGSVAPLAAPRGFMELKGEGGGSLLHPQPDPLKWGGGGRGRGGAEGLRERGWKHSQKSCPVVGIGMGGHRFWHLLGRGWGRLRAPRTPGRGEPGGSGGLRPRPPAGFPRAGPLSRRSLAGSAAGRGWELGRGTPSPRSGGAQAFSWCHCATACRGRAIMSFQCFTSPGPLFQDR